MKLLSKSLVLACVVAIASSVASAGFAATRSTTSPLLGNWSLDTSRLPMPPAQRPKSVSFAFEDAGGGRMAVHVDIVYAPGSEVHSVTTAALDGTSAAVENSPEADHVSLKQPVPNVLVMALQKDGVLVSTRIYSVMPDNRQLVETVVYPGTKDSLVMKTNYFIRAS